jgi:hypothetical protein
LYDVEGRKVEESESAQIENWTLSLETQNSSDGGVAICFAGFRNLFIGHSHLSRCVTSQGWIGQLPPPSGPWSKLEADIVVGHVRQSKAMAALR